MKKIITLVLFNRPDYTKTVLDALQQCDGIEDYLILPHIDPGNEEVIGLAKGIDFAETKLTVNPTQLGCGLNTFTAWQDGFQHGEFIVHVEDDTVPARDCLSYMEHCCATYADDSAIFSVASYNREPCPSPDYYGIGRRSAYTCWLIGTWRNRWEWVKDNWDPNPKRYARHLAQQVLQRDLQEVHPLLSRSQNIGAERGLHVRSAEWHREHHHTEHWAGTFGLPPGSYYEKPGYQQAAHKSKLRSSLKLSYCVTCMGRLHHLKKTLPANLQANEAFNVEFVLLDYNSQDGLGEWIQSEFQSELQSGRLVYFRTDEPAYFTASKAKNLSHRLASGDVLCNLDADNFAQTEFTEHLVKLFERTPNSVTKGAEDNGFVGRVALPKSWFHWLGGYDEDFDGYGFEDRDLYLRAKRGGLVLHEIPRQLAKYIAHSNTERVQKMAPQNAVWRGCVNSSKWKKTIAAKPLIANEGRAWGVAKLLKNFNEPIEFESTVVVPAKPILV